jgi:hypothetical protein
MADGPVAGRDGGGVAGPVGLAVGPVADLVGDPVDGPVEGPDAGAPEVGGLDTGRVGADGPDAGRAGAGAPLAVSGAEPLEPLVSARIGDGRRVRNQADSTSRKIGGSSIVWSGRGSPERSSAAEPS